MTYRDYLDRQGVPRGPWVVRERDSDRSGEAGETTQIGSTEGESAVRLRNRPNLRAIK